jgi:hypothetical protein
MHSQALKYGKDHGWPDCQLSNHLISTMKKYNNILLLFVISILTITACQNESSTVEYDFNSLNDRIWYPEKKLVKEFSDIIPDTATGRSELVIDFN